LPLVSEDRQADCSALWVNIRVEYFLLALQQGGLIRVVFRNSVNESQFAVLIETRLGLDDNVHRADFVLLRIL